VSQISHEGSWIEEFTSAPGTGPRYFGEFFGIKNFALCKAILPDHLPKQAKNLDLDTRAVLWLELHHNPTLPHAKHAKSRSTSLIQYQTTFVPLHKQHLESLTQNLYTARFVVKDNAARIYYFEEREGTPIALPSKVPDGCYEFYHGKAYSIGFGGTATELKNDHPIYPKSARELAFWINFGINFFPESVFAKSSQMPTRFAYFKNGDLFLMGGPVICKDDPILKSLEKDELARQEKNPSYLPFLDPHAEKRDPITPAFIKAYGLHIPEKQYLLLGDNPAMSLDCRFFGTIPEENLQGSPVLLFWPFGERFGCPQQPHKMPSVYTLFWVLGFSLCIYAYQRHSKKKALQFLEQLKQEKG
jgi:signal peptidase I